MSDTMRARLQQSDWIFSGMKTFHELNEAFPSLLDEKGERKPFEQFLNDVRSIDEKYNRNYLRAEYNFANASASMAGRWESFADDDDYLLEYRTAGDDKVRPEHAEMAGIKLPKSDIFWDVYYPPNGWNCRCTVVEVLRATNTPTNSKDAFDRAKSALRGDKKGMFRFNPGKEQKTFPDYNPYTISHCTNCDIAKGKMSLAKPLNNQVCASCSIIRTCADYELIETKRGQIKVHKRHGEDEREENITIAKYFAERYSEHIRLLPRSNDKKCADAYNLTKDEIQEYKKPVSNSKTSIDNAIRDANRKATTIVLIISDEFDIETLSRGIKGRILQCKNITKVVILKGKKDATYSVNDIREPNWKANWADLK